MTGPHFHPNFLYVPFFPIPLFTKWGTTAVYLFVMGTGICAMVPLLPFIDRPKIVKGGGGPLRSYINNTQLVSFLSFSSFISQYVVCLHVLLWLPGGGLGWQEEILTCVPNPCNTTPFEW